MSVNRACYCTRQDVMSATDVKQQQDYVRHVDSAIEAASRSVDKLCNRRFFNEIKTYTYEWPNFQRAYPWRIWFDKSELADVTTLVPVVTTGTQVIPNSAIFWAGSSNYNPPYRYMELDRSQSYAFGNGPTPQRNVNITGNTGYWTQTEPGGTITASINNAVTSVAVSDSYVVGVGDVLIVDSESMLVRDMTWSTTGLTLSSGGTTAQDNDNVLTLSGSGIIAGETIQIDAEWMLALTVSASSVTVERAWNGSVLATHSTSATVLAQRTCAVARAYGGTTAASHSNGASFTLALVPDMVHELALAEALVTVEQKARSYGTPQGSTGMASTPGGGLPDLRDRTYAAYARKVRQRAV